MTTHGRDSSVSEFDGRVRIPVTNHMVDVAQLVERQIVALEVMGSNPIFLPIEKDFDYYQMIASEAF